MFKLNKLEKVLIFKDQQIEQLNKKLIKKQVFKPEKGILDQIIKRNLQIQLDHENLYIKGTVKDFNGKEYSLKEIFGDEMKIVFRFSYSNCLECVDFMLDKAKKVIEKVGRENIVFLGSFRDNVDFNKLIRTQKEINPIFNVSKLNLQIEESNAPYYFLIKESKVFSLFLPDKKKSELMDFHLKLILEKYFKH